MKNNADPVFITINPWTLEANDELNNADGELTHSFTDAWVYIDNRPNWNF